MTVCAYACLANVICFVVMGVHVCTNLMYYLYAQKYLEFVVYTSMQIFVELSWVYTNVYTSYMLSGAILLYDKRVYKYKHESGSVVPDDTINYHTPGIQYVDTIGRREQVERPPILNGRFHRHLYMGRIVFLYLLWGTTCLVRSLLLGRAGGLSRQVHS